MLLCSYSSYAQTLEIVRLNTKSVMIGSGNSKRICYVGSTFQSNEIINWSEPKQDMWVKTISGNSRELLHFTRESFNSRGAVTPAEYYNKINHLSVKFDEIAVGKNKNAFQEKRIALVIGNSNYRYLSSLNNPINDAADISEKLRNLGFDVLTFYDLNYEDFNTALNKFSGITKGFEVALVYYCGHGIQYEGKNYLVPIDNILSKVEDLYRCIQLEDVYSKLNRTTCKTKLVFIDACRNEATWITRKEVFNEQDASGIRVVFSTGPNKFSYDGTYRNSPFAEAFLQNVGKPASNVLTTINEISLSLDPISSRMGLPKQEVHDFGSSALDFTFVDETSSNNVVVNDIDQLIQLANSGDTRAYVPLAKYYLNHAAGITSYEKVHIFCIKAIDAGVDVDEAKDLIRKLELLEFYERSDYTKPKF